VPPADVGEVIGAPLDAEEALGSAGEAIGSREARTARQARLGPVRQGLGDHRAGGAGRARRRVGLDVVSRGTRHAPLTPHSLQGEAVLNGCPD
jgi:hypothetical protein